MHPDRNETKGGVTSKSEPLISPLSLPKGGGAIRGVGEKFSANPVTGTASLSIPIFSTPGRSDFYPKLSLSYDSGSGNGPFGFGWQLSAPAVTRKTDQGLPTYQDDDDSDVFILSGVDDLVPALNFNGVAWARDSFQARLDDARYTVQRYRPRVEGLFARIERWCSDTTGLVHWKTVSRDNVTSLYGLSQSSQISDPGDSARVFKWMLDRSYDDKGNLIVYEYKPEDPINVPPSAHEENRRPFANRYLKRIKYGNASPYHPTDRGPLATDWFFEIVFDYGEHDSTAPGISDRDPWLARADPFSSYRAGFEVRTYRLCRRVLMFHHFPSELGTPDYLVRSTDLVYDEGPLGSFITSITQAAYLVGSDGAYIKDSLPPVEFTYTQPVVDPMVRSVEASSLENLPSGLDGDRYQWVDLDSEGLPGILTEQAGAWFYKRNLSDVTLIEGDTPSQAAARFGPVEIVATKPSLADLSGGYQQLMDLAGDGQLCLVQFRRPLPGFYEREQDGGWLPFIPFPNSPNIEWNNPNLKSIDLTGDGYADLLVSEDQIFTWYPSLAKKGFGSSRKASTVLDDEKGPALVFADATQSIYVADLSGDGLTDIVRIRNGEVCYWPNLGYGRFGARVTMDQAPWFDQPDQFEQKRIRLADIDGSGATDIIYLGRDKISFWLNQSGNSWSRPHHLEQFPKTDNLSSVMAVDLLGNGTACLVWSSPLPGDASRPMRYIELMSGQKPHLLTSVKNNLGAETRVKYAPSTRYYLRDRAAGRPWITKLPFPLHVVERVEVYDYVSSTKLVTTYEYHHGYFDGPEREFRGFGMVEQFDTESFSMYSGAGLFTETPEGEGEEFHLPPVYTKTWFHTGAYMAQQKISRQFENEYYQGDSLATPLTDSVLPSGLTVQEEREACRALKGSVLRQEVYADDTSSRRVDPYTVVEHCYGVRMVQAQAGNDHAVFHTHDREVVEYHYERNPHDPRLSHRFTLEVDAFGNVTKSATVAYPRRRTLPTTEQPHPPDHPNEQRKTHIVYVESDFTNKVDTTGAYRMPLAGEVRTYELTPPPVSEGARYSAQLILRAAASATQIQYEDSSDDTTTQKRLIERVRVLYRKDDLSGPLPGRRLESLALPFESYKQAFTPGLLNRIYGSKLTPAQLDELLGNEGQYRNLDGDGVWWIPSGQLFFSPDPVRPDRAFGAAHFYLPKGSIDPFGGMSRVTYDEFDLLVTRTEDALHNVVMASNDYRVMQPDLMIDPNDNRTGVRFDTLGMVVATAVMGKTGRSEGDTLADPTTRLEYNLFNWMRNGRPNFVHTFAREQHGATNPRWQESFSYSDGVGREVMKKIQAEPGLVRQIDAAGNVIEVNTSRAVRWVGTGRTVLNNKGKPVKKYEPFFSSTPAYETEERLMRVGVTPILRYDPRGRLIRTDLPNGTFSRVAFDPWKQITYDENDTVRESRWYEDRGSPDPTAREPADAAARAAWLAAKHAGTPAVAHLDSLGRTFLTVADNGLAADGAARKSETRVEMDIAGNLRSVTDARDNCVMEFDYDMLGTKIHQRSMDAGERWMLNDAAGQPIRAWDSRSHTIRTTYDRLRRPTQLFVRAGSGAERLAEHTVYGEPARGDSVGDAEARRLNLRGRIRRHYDGSGLVINGEFDFKGNTLRGARQFADEYRLELDWSMAPAPSLQTEIFRSSTTYDALNRPLTMTMPDGTVVRPIFNEANLLERVSVALRGAATPTAFVNNIDYDAKGQRQSIEYRINGRSGVPSIVRTEYRYDPFTFALMRLITTRTSDGTPLQDLRYTYDPVGNITVIRDDAQQEIYFRNTFVEPSATYEYDALYRLISATGREHLGQNASGRLNPPQQVNHDDSFRANLLHSGDGNAMGNYTERYEYDAVGNILRMIHQAAGGSWTRRFAYDEPSLTESGRTNNRLSRTSLPGDPEGSYSARYTYNEHGSMTSMPHLPTLTPDQPALEWDFKDQLHKVRTQAVVDGETGETVYYVYDAAGERARKVIERPGGTVREERMYLGSYEVYRERIGGRVTLERETLHIMDDQRRIALVETKTIDAAAPPFTPAPLIRYQLSNHLGSASLELDDAGEIISYEEYFPYGSTSYRAVRRGVEVSPKRYRYTGKERDEETGFYYHGARYYAPWLGRWTSVDPLGLVDGPNLYRYTKGNPVRLTDPSGTQSAEDCEPGVMVYGGRDPARRAELQRQERERQARCTEAPSAAVPSAAPSARPSQANPSGETDAERNARIDQIENVAGFVSGVILGAGDALTFGLFSRIYRTADPRGTRDLERTRSFEAARRATELVVSVATLRAGGSGIAGGLRLERATVQMVRPVLSGGGAAVAAIPIVVPVVTNAPAVIHGAGAVAVAGAGVLMAMSSDPSGGGGAGGSGGSGSGGSPPLEGDTLALGGEGENPDALNFNIGGNTVRSRGYEQARQAGRVIEGDFNNPLDWQRFATAGWRHVEARAISLSVGDPQVVRALLEQIRRVLRPGGTLFITRNSRGLEVMEQVLIDLGFVDVRVAHGFRVTARLPP